MSKGNVNKVILVGNLGHEPELRHTQKGHPYLALSLATDREFKNAQGVPQKETAWHRATLWGKRAEGCAKYLTKGSRVYLEGELRTQSWTDKEGVQRKTAEIHVDEIKFLGGTKPSGMKEESEAPALAH
jgi:single-strand DNA-binding protein